MQMQDSVSPVSEKQLFIKMALDAWNTQNSRLIKVVNGLTDQQLAAETAPGRNTGTYLFGHLVAVSDGLFPILAWDEKSHPELEATFLVAPDKSGLPFPSVEELKSYFAAINLKIAECIAAMPVDEWFNRHTSVSPEDFAREPHRNKLNILINRTNHMAYHLGQLIYLTGK